MKTAKHFDCVAMKNRIQAEQAERHRQLDDDQVRRKVRQELDRSTNPVGRLWQALETKADDTS